MTFFGKNMTGAGHALVSRLSPWRHCIFYPSSISRNDIHKPSMIYISCCFSARLGLIQMIEFITFINRRVLRLFLYPTWWRPSSSYSTIYQKSNNTSTIIRQGNIIPILKASKTVSIWDRKQTRISSDLLGEFPEITIEVISFCRLNPIENVGWPHPSNPRSCR